MYLPTLPRSREACVWAALPFTVASSTSILTIGGSAAAEPLELGGFPAGGRVGLLHIAKDKGCFDQAGVEAFMPVGGADRFLALF
jgi:hypothetical protein